MALRVAVVFAVIALSQSKLLDLSCQHIQAFVDGHNARRLMVAKGEVDGQPGAAEMKYMIWDTELATKAAKWAANNKFHHNPDRTVGSGRFGTGENLYKSSTTNYNHKMNPDAALESWFSEYKNYKYGPLSMADFEKSEQIGHYTQMVWSDSIYVGCAVSETSSNGWHSQLYVCNYGPSGNYVGRTPYKASESGSSQLKCALQDCSRKYGDRC